MTWRDKLEIGLREDAPYRRDNLPETEQRGPERPAGPGRSPVVENTVKARLRRRNTKGAVRKPTSRSRASSGRAAANDKKTGHRR
jgi:hypothetical protein